ncbi:MAG: hypothetical protein HC772_12600 [Leptolyngbyaceae cyanobacterium CRU_2_3]|nr:hypothetical protein [Leptolyngbyaceae cyanobacterium CRU_2_3]
MVLQPELLLLDEPTAYLDQIQARDLMAKLRQIQAMGTTIVMATHDLDLAYCWADWISFLIKGNWYWKERLKKSLLSEKPSSGCKWGCPWSLMC